MDFKTVIGILVKDFGSQEIDYALIGGFAMGALGIMRSTMDLDLLVKQVDLTKIDDILATHGYHLRYRSDNVSQYLSDAKPLGSIALLHAFRRHALTMLQRARKIPIFSGQYSIPVVIPEDLIGLKLQAMVNNPKRKTLASADIELLGETFGSALDWPLIQSYCDLFEMQDYFDALRSKYAAG